MDLHEIFSIVPQWGNKYEVTLNLTQPHLPSFVMTYHDLATKAVKPAVNLYPEMGEHTDKGTGIYRYKTDVNCCTNPKYC